jgi:hypothetical protein
VVSGSARKGAEHPFPKDAGAIEVWPNPAHNLQAEIAYRVLPQFLVEDHIFNPLPGLEQPAVLDLSIDLANCPLLFPVEVHTGDELAVWSEDRVLRLGSGQSFFDEPDPAYRLAATSK